MSPLNCAGMPLLGKLLGRFRAGEARSPLAGRKYAAARTIDVTSTAFTDGGAIPQKHAGKGAGDNVSPALQWTGVPAEAKQLVLIMDDLDVPMPKPLMHTIAVIEPHLGGLAEGELKPGTTGVRLIKAFGDTYLGPRRSPVMARITIDSSSSHSTNRSPTASPITRPCCPRSQATCRRAVC